MDDLAGIDAALYGADLFGGVARPKPSGVVAARFGVPPFTVLDARSGEWQERKRAWLALGIRGEEGRAAQCYASPQLAAAKGGYVTADGDQTAASTSSVFDPVVCELAYRWWCPPKGQIVDPFAGGSVRGIVAGALGRSYWGCDLRAEQVDANGRQANEVPTQPRPVWACGDSMDTLESAPEADFVFSCPPYGDLERYSDDPRDLSAMEWHTFAAAYKRIVLRACSRLRPDRFACFVVGDFRDGRGFYRNFVSETIAAFEACGARLYNDAVLVTAVGSASMRVTRQFDAGRKLAKTHQNVLVFCKGDWRAASAAIGKGA